MATADDNPPAFDKDQLSRYFDHIKLPQKYHGDDVPRDLAFLTVLHRHQIAAVPYENLTLHYSPQKTIDLDTQTLYTKIVSNGRNRGGYCMEGSLFFLNILRSLGFHAYPTVVRIRLREDGVPTGDYVTITHIVLIISLPIKDGSSEKYVCDAAFGGDGPLFPMPLKEGVVTQNLGTQEIRFAYERIPKATSQKFWVYQYRNGPEKPWNSFYAFMDAECLENDFNAINFYTSQAPTFQKTTVIIVKFILGPDEETGDNKITGKLLLVNGTIKRNMGGKTEVVEVCKTEAERILAMEKWFGITLTEDEVTGIKETITELKTVEVLGA